ncbi:MAG: DUF2065 domain-containing protein [Deltaproteobacteria bacterium]|nr:DUF2065 domain-containing protein [Deltaproteobacteria bacterium]
MKLLFLVVGIIFIIEGLPYFAFPDKMKTWMRRIQDLPDSHLRIMGLVALVIGWIMVYIFKN